MIPLYSNIHIIVQKQSLQTNNHFGQQWLKMFTLCNIMTLSSRTCSPSKDPLPTEQVYRLPRSCSPLSLTRAVHSGILRNYLMSCHVRDNSCTMLNLNAALYISPEEWTGGQIWLASVSLSLSQVFVTFPILYIFS